MASSSDSAKDEFEALSKAAANEEERQMAEKLRDEFYGGPFEDEFTDFMKTAYDGDARKFYEGGNISTEGWPEGLPPLHYAALRGHTHLCAFFIETRGFDVNAIGSQRGATPLHCAAFENHVATAVCLIDHGADVNSKDNLGYYTPLHIAATRGYEELVLLLIARGSDIEAISETGTPLQCAMAASQKGTVTVLLVYKANLLNFQPNYVSLCFLRPLLLSAMTNSVECSRLLVKGYLSVLDELQKTLKMQPNSTQIQNDIRSIKDLISSTKDYENAIDVFSKALELQPSSTNIQNEILCIKEKTSSSDED